MFPPNSPLSRKFIARRRQSGFSLVEVVLAVGVISFAFVAIMGLIPAGLQQFRQAMDNSVCSQIAQRIIQDAQLTDFDTLTDAAHPVGDAAHPYNYANSYAASDVGRTNPIHVRYFDEQGNEIVPQAASPSNAELASVVYFVNTRISVSTNLPGITTDHSSSNAGLATVLVQVAFNPSGKKIQMDDTNKVFDPTYTKNMPVKNFSAQVGRN